jgi:hypothetical protein
MTALLLALVGSLTGLHAATWGGFKDSPFEGFRRASFLRSIILGVACAPFVALAGVADLSSGVLVAVGFCYACERLVTEWWKAILRGHSQAAYSIPMRLAVRGRPVDARLPRYATGAGIALGLVAAFVGASWLQELLPERPWWVTFLTVGLGGWLTAVGGAWKDAPVEGFQVAKFFRSPVVATVWGCLLLPFCSELPVLIVAAAGLAVTSIETYKTFVAGGAPGKFAGKPVRFAPTRARRLCLLTHGATYGLLVLVLAVALLHGHAEGQPSGQLGRDAASLVAMVWAAAFGTLVLQSLRSATVETNQASGRPAERSGRLSDAYIRRASI